MNTCITKRIIAATWLLLITNPLQAWQGGGGTGVPDEAAVEVGGLSQQVQTTREEQYDTDLFLTGGTEADVPRGNARQVSSDGVMITWSENNDELRGFSNSLGEWETLKIEKQDEIIPVVGSGVAAVQIGDSIAAFSGVKGWWDVIPLSKVSAAQPTVSDGLVLIEDNGHFYAFSASQGRWTSPTDTDLQSATSELRLRSGLKLQQQGQRLDEWFKSLPRYKARGIQFSFTSELGGRASIHTVRRSWLKEAEDKLNEITAQPEPTTSPEAVENSSSEPDDATGLESRITSLRKELLSLDGDVNANDADQDGKTREARKQALRKLVEQSFDLRQQLQRLEAQRMQLKLQLIETNLDARDKNREDIIRHRVDELLKLSVKDAERDTEEKTTRTANPGTPAAGTPIGVPGPPQLPLGGPADLKSHPVRNIDAGIPWPQPAEIVKDLRGKMQDVTSKLNDKVQQQEEVEQWSRPLEQLQSEGIADKKMTETTRQKLVDMYSTMFRSTQSKTDILQRDWRNAWSTYQSRLRLLRLDVDEAQLALEPLQQTYDRLKSLADSGNAPVSRVTQAASDLAIARIKVERAIELLQLYAAIETTEPELDPASLDTADSTKPDSSPMPVPDVRDPPLPDAPDDSLAPQEKAVKP